tara:strand:- start:672 stop:1415 length:744 start_codon:yes stop_codon:yes gene_type:complete
MNKHPEIEVKNLTKNINSKQILIDINLKLNHKSHLVIIGGSGAGKSMLMKCILGLQSLSGGKVLFKGDNVGIENKRAEFLMKIGVCFQGNALFDSYKVWENIAFEKIYAKQAMSRKKARDNAIAKLLEVGLPKETADLYPYELSGGMQKRVGIARAIFSNPDILFFDEPTTGLDPLMSRKIIALIKEIMSNSIKSAITITHDINLALSLASEIILLHEGHVEWSGLKTQISQTRSKLIKEFLKGTIK